MRSWLRIRTLAGASAAAVLALLLSGCADEDRGAAPSTAVTAVEQRNDRIQQELDAWSDADSLGVARRAAEAVSNLVTGPDVDYFGDADDDGTVDGDVEVGLLPGQGGDPGLGTPLASCAGADLLGGSWEDPASRWADLETKVDAWTPSNNPFPQLASHAQRVVGWARLTLRATTLEEAVEYSGHARLHVDAVVRAVDDCG